MYLVNSTINIRKIDLCTMSLTFHEQTTKIMILRIKLLISLKGW